MSNNVELSSELKNGRRALEELPNIKLLDDWLWDDQKKKWVLHCRLSPDVKQEGPIPNSTDWYILVDPQYPIGSIKFYPSKSGGIKETYQHQLHNGEGEAKFPWRTGELCLVDPFHILGRPHSQIEPLGGNDRLKWHFKRALEWLVQASNGNLVDEGEPFELPDYPISNAKYQLAFNENQETYNTWKSLKDRTGIVLLSQFMNSWLVARIFLSSTQKELVKPDWGTAIMASRDTLKKAIWIRLDSLPVIPPWGAPTTWGQLRQLYEEQGFDLDANLQSLAGQIRDGYEHPLLVGFPIPKDVGDSPCRLHWLALSLPILSYGKKVPNGFRPNEQGYWHRDRTSLLTNTTLLNWVDSENWEDEQLTSRGRLSASFVTKKYTLIGVGALGSAVTEILVRGGVRNLTLVDSDILATGNLVRHTLTMPDIDKKKARALADHLNLINPNAKVQAISSDFSQLEDEELRFIRESDVIIDCTASNEVLETLNTFTKDGDGIIFSFSIGFRSTRLYCFAVQKNKYNDSMFHKNFEPWQEEESKEISSDGFPREGIGCWHPVFPARSDDIWLMASTVVKYIEDVSARIVQVPDFTVFTQERQDRLFTGLRRIT